MSFVRQPRSIQASSRQMKQKTKRKKKVPAWDNTMSDLSVHKLTKEEVERRKEVHQSKNLAAVRADRQMRALMKANRKKLLSQDDSGSSSLLQEILYDEEHLRDAISHSDRVMAVVKDLFGDDPRVKSGKANVTLAPGVDRGDRVPKDLPDMTLNPSHLDVLSESVMDQQALNEVAEDEEYTDDSSKENQFQGFEGSLDLERFRRYIAKESANREHHQEKWNSDKRQQSGSKAQRKIQEDRRVLKEWHSNNLTDSERDRSDEESQTESRAINDTAKVKKKSRARTSEENGISNKNDADLAKVIHGIQDEVRDYEQVTGKRVLSEADGGQSSGLTVFLVQTIRTLIHHLTEKEKQAGSDDVLSTMKRQLAEHRSLIDALTTEMIITQEGLSRLEAQMQGKVNMTGHSSQTSIEHRMKETSAEPERDQAGDDNQKMLNKPPQLLGDSLKERSPRGHSNVLQQQNHHRVPSDSTLPQRGPGVTEESSNQPYRVANQYLNHLRHEDPLQADYAIMLSPPRQRDRRTLFKDHGPNLAKRELFFSQINHNEKVENFGMKSGMAAQPIQVSDHSMGSASGDPLWSSTLDHEVPMGSAFRPSMNSLVSHAQGNQIPVRDQGNGNSEARVISNTEDLPAVSTAQSLGEGRNTTTPSTDVGQPLFHRVDWKLKDTSIMSTDSHTSYRSLPSMQGGEQTMKTGSSMKVYSEQVSSGQLNGQDSRVPLVGSEPGLITSEEGALNAISDLNRRIAALSREHADAEERLSNLKKNQGLIYN